MRETQKLIYQALLTYYLTNGVPPTVRQLSNIVKRNQSTTQRHLTDLEELGWIRKAGGTGPVSRGWIPVKDKVVLRVENEAEPDEVHVGEAPSEDTEPL